MKKNATIYVTVRIDFEYNTDKTDLPDAKQTAAQMIDANTHTIEQGVQVYNFDICDINEE